MSRLKDKYTSEVAPALQETFRYKSTMQVPHLEKIVLNMSTALKPFTSALTKAAAVLSRQGTLFTTKKSRL